MLDQVFVSYRRENDAHVERVRRFAEELRKQELVVAFDEFYLRDHPGGPDEKWSRWCINQARESACVLIIGSPGWYDAFGSPQVELSAEGRGAAAEAHVIQEQLYVSKWRATRHRIVLLDDADKEGLPTEIAGWRIFRPNSSAQDKEDLIRWAVELTHSKDGDARKALTIVLNEPDKQWRVTPPDRIGYSNVLRAISKVAKVVFSKGPYSTEADLPAGGILILPTPRETVFDKDECKVISSWVRSGGSVLVMGIYMV
jgi:hypothetical protein